MARMARRQLMSTFGLGLAGLYVPKRSYFFGPWPDLTTNTIGMADFERAVAILRANNQKPPFLWNVQYNAVVI